MAIRQDISRDLQFFIGEDKTIEFEVLQSDGATPQDVSGWALEWDMRAKVSDAAALLAKTSGSGIAVMGVYSAVRATNTQRVAVTIAAEDTDALSSGRHAHALKRTDDGNEAVLSYGDCELQRSAAH